MPEPNTPQDCSVDQVTELRRRARYAAGRAVAETRTGLPYLRVSIAPGDPFVVFSATFEEWSSPRDAEGLLVRLHAGLAALLLLEPDAEQASRHLAQGDLHRAQQVRAQLLAVAPHVASDEQAYRQQAHRLVSEPANLNAIGAVANELQRVGSLTMEEVDFLVEHADGDPDALDALHRYRQLFASEPVPWPDQT